MQWISETDRLKLRVWSENDIEAGLKIWGDPTVMKYVAPKGPENRDEVADSIQHGIKHQDSHGTQHWAVIEKSSDELIGCCGFNIHSDKNTYEMVFHFSKKSWGKGYATEAGLAALDYAKTLAIRRVVANVHPENKASGRVLEKLGFKQSGEVYMEDFDHKEPFYEILLSE